ncbi:phosphopantetheine-binding protein [Streptomyces sp. NPDC058368]|uniref:phosphopantetheine-binding protein n=1 Tax=Streptomyces sp. NPDC058368 TaxID=3346461 RepID=UPI003658B5EB
MPAPALPGGGREPSTERERLLCTVLADALDVERVGVDDDFFALGGDSITAITVSSRLRALGLGLRPKDLPARRTFAALAASAELLDGADGPADEPVGPVPAPPIVRALLDPHPDIDTVAGYAQWTALHVDALTPEQLTRAAGALNLLNTVGGSVGTAAVAVILENRLAATGADVPAAFGDTFWWVLGFCLFAAAAATRLPRTRPRKG